MPNTLMTFDEMRLGRQFAPFEFTIDQRTIDYFSSVVAATPSAAPVGLLAVYARRAYLTEGVMPSGGVMASLDVTYTAALPIGRPLTASAVVNDSQERKGRGWVTIDVTFADAGTAFASARVVGVWPL